VPAWRLGEEVVEMTLAGRRARQQETTTTKRRQHRFGRAGGKVRGDDGVKGIAAIGQDLTSCGRGLRVTRGHDSFRHDLAASL